MNLSFKDVPSLDFKKLVSMATFPKKYEWFSRIKPLEVPKNAELHTLTLIFIKL